MKAVHDLHAPVDQVRRAVKRDVVGRVAVRGEIDPQRVEDAETVQQGRQHQYDRAEAVGDQQPAVFARAREYDRKDRDQQQFAVMFDVVERHFGGVSGDKGARQDHQEESQRQPGQGLAQAGAGMMAVDAAEQGRNEQSGQADAEEGI